MPRLTLKPSSASRHIWRGFWAGLVLSLVVGQLPCRALDPDLDPHDYLFAEWNTNHGIPYTAIRGLLQTNDGYVWVFTRG
jgi:ligand-binding sensor domain-containing protein